VSTLTALFSALITAPEATEFEVAVVDEKEAELIRTNLVKRLSAYRGQLGAVLPSDQLPKSLKMRLDKDANLAIFSIGARSIRQRQVNFRIVEVKEIQE
jgi:hypothetical protein